MPPEIEDELIEEEQAEKLFCDGGTPMGISSTSEKVVSTQNKRKKDILSRIDFSNPLQGSKLDAIAEYILSVPKDEKIIIFSQFGDMLELIQIWLQRASVKAVKLTGSLMLSQRQAVLQAFLHDPGVRAILISLKAGGEGLNLQVANHVILVDPWWNPAVEMQAAQRAHRIGQTKPVRVVRFVVERSVEERMMDLQDKKMLVIEGTIDGKFSSLQSLSEDDLQFLFTR
ncbi:DNA repair protein [Trypanosoma cruzi]|nr:DNA repair protein [Trypanosoma cruzi]